MKKLISGLHAFQTRHFSVQRPLFESLARGQTPEALFITCSDSRIDPNLLTQSQPGELFILRNAGNLVPPYRGHDGGGATATIEYAVTALKVKHIIICGHSLCGAMQALLEPGSLEGLPTMANWLGNADATAEIMRTNFRDLPPEKRLLTTVEQNVLVQLDNLRTQPSVAARLRRGDLELHAWVYEIEQGAVTSYNPDTNKFVPLLPDAVAAG